MLSVENIYYWKVYNGKVQRNAMYSKRGKKEKENFHKLENHFLMYLLGSYENLIKFWIL